MRLADRYIVSELLLFFLVSTTAVLTLFVGMAVLFHQDDFQSLPYTIPYYLSLTLPVAIALAASLSVNRMTRDNELTVFRGTGTPLVRAFLPIFIVGLLVSIGDYILFDIVLPSGLQKRMHTQGQSVEPVSPGATFVVDRYTISYARSQRLSEAKRHLWNLVVVESPAQGGTPRNILTAEEATYENGLWKLQRAIHHSFDASGIILDERASATEQWNMAVDFSNLYRRPDAAQFQFTFTELMEKSRESRRFGNIQDALAYEVDAWTKLALPAMAFVFTLFATPLALKFARTGSFAGVMLSIGAVFVAWNTLLLLQYVGYGGYLPPATAAWATDVLFGIPGIFLLYFADR